MLRANAIAISSVRGNLLKNYYFTYGWLGYVLAYAHLVMLRGFTHVVAMSKSMADQLRGFGVRRIRVIGSFVDEGFLEDNRNSVVRDGCDTTHFLFLGSLTERKRPDLVVRAVGRMLRAGISVRLSVAGDGPRRRELESLVSELGLGRRVVLYGHVSEPYRIIQDCDYLVLPSESEGISRAALESLYYGVPCIARDVDGNRELIEEGKNGFLFGTDEELFATMVKASRLVSGGPRPRSKTLIPAFFGKQRNVLKFKELVEV